MNVGPPIRVARTQERRRVVAGLLAALERRGPGELEEADVIAAAGVSARVFHEHFRDLDECFDFACEAGLDILLGPMVAAWSVPRSACSTREQMLARGAVGLIAAHLADCGGSDLRELQPRLLALLVPALELDATG